MNTVRVGWVLFGALVLVLLLGPELAPHPAARPVGPPYASIGALGTDLLGRDVFSRLLHGGRPLILTSATAALLGAAIGAAAGIGAALARRRWLASLVMRPLDAAAAVPGVLVVLLVLTAMPDRMGLVVAIAVVGVPLSARVAMAAASGVVGRAHLEAAVARGERLPWLIGREVLPLIAGPLLADLGIRFVAAVYLVAAAGFLGVATGEADWGASIVAALPGAALQPWSLAAPLVGVTALTVGANLAVDRILRRSRSVAA